jgi:hypothetical protein
MKKNLLLLVAALIVLGFAVRKLTEGFGTEAEFLDKQQVIRTVLVENSSYDQVTNHLRPAVETFGPATGTPTPFQVNQYRARIQ